MKFAVSLLGIGLGFSLHALESTCSQSQLEENVKKIALEFGSELRLMSSSENMFFTTKCDSVLLQGKMTQHETLAYFARN